ncbi:MAG: formylglycine-generating enzyme family protein [Geminicoccaceae bacterium]
MGRIGQAPPRSSQRRVGLAAPGSVEQRYLRWSTARTLVGAGVLATILGVLGEALYWKTVNELPLEAVWTRWAYMLGKELPMPKLVRMPEGTFMMGSELGREYERPVHSVTFTEPLHLGPTEVTFAQFSAFTGATGRQPPDDSGWGSDNRPVINVDWWDARDYARWLGAMTGTTCRLPSEAEWEYACRAGTTTEFALPAETGGSDDIAGKGLANCADCGSEWDGDQTAPVGSFPANAWGMHDMHGNVWEWVEDCWHESYHRAPVGGQAWLEENHGGCPVRVLRSGSWNNFRNATRCALRDWNQPSNVNSTLGFRVVCSSPIIDG